MKPFEFKKRIKKRRKRIQLEKEEKIREKISEQSKRALADKKAA